MKRPASPKKTRDYERTRAEILEVAFGEVFARGFQGVSVDDIVKKTSLTKGAFYHHFPTKLDLGYALVEEVIQPLITNRWIEPLAAHENPVKGILSQLRRNIGEASAAQLKLGCPLNNLVQEMAPVDPGFRSRLENALAYWIDEIEKQLLRARKNGQLQAEVNVRQAAHFIVMAHEGFYGMLKGLNDPKAFETLYESLKRYLKTLEA